MEGQTKMDGRTGNMGFGALRQWLIMITAKNKRSKSVEWVSVPIESVAVQVGWAR